MWLTFGLARSGARAVLRRRVLDEEVTRSLAGAGLLDESLRSRGIGEVAPGSTTRRGRRRATSLVEEPASSSGSSTRAGRRDAYVPCFDVLRPGSFQRRNTHFALRAVPLGWAHSDARGRTTAGGGPALSAVSRPVGCRVDGEPMWQTPFAGDKKADSEMTK